MDEVFVKIGGIQHYLWRAVDQDGEVVDVFLQKSRNAKAAKRFFKRLFKSHKGKTRKIVTDKLASYGVAHRELSPDIIHDKSQYANNLSELSHMRRAPQLGQKPRRLQLKASKRSCLQVSQLRRKKPYSSRPHLRKSSNSCSIYFGKRLPCRAISSLSSV